MTPRADHEPVTGQVPIRLYLFPTGTRPRWAARIDLPSIGAPEGYGALPDQALRALADQLTSGDIARMRAHAAGQNGTPV